tara:strand:- start:932 stop:1510 length:579 start_codon:yes stop_codon:yes gene_type:complete
MSITNGVNISCDDLQSSGGIRNILLRTWTAGDVISYSNTASSHAISSIQAAGVDATWFNYEFKNEQPSLSVTASRENGSTSFECSLTFMMPQMTNNKGAAIMGLLDNCSMAIAVGNNGIHYVLGVSQKYSNAADSVRNQTFTTMTSAEGASGAAYNDENGWTVTMGCKQWEAPRVYTGDITLYATSSTSTTT